MHGHEIASKKQEVYLRFGIETAVGNIDGHLLETEWVVTGIEESYWEKCYEFEPGIAETRQLVEKGTYPDFKTALYTVLCHFMLCFNIDGEEKELDCEIDLDTIMYTLLLETF